MTKPSYFQHLDRAFAPQIQYAWALPKVQTFPQAKFYDSKHDNFSHHFQKSYLKIQIRYQKVPTKSHYIQSSRNLFRPDNATKHPRYPVYQISQ